jgi:hypothetical protein
MGHSIKIRIAGPVGFVKRIFFYPGPRGRGSKVRQPACFTYLVGVARPVRLDGLFNWPGTGWSSLDSAGGA